MTDVFWATVGIVLICIAIAAPIAIYDDDTDAIKRWQHHLEQTWGCADA